MSNTSLQFGKVSELFIEKQEGSVISLNNITYPFHFSAVREEISKGDLVAFVTQFSRGSYTARQMATAIQRAYVSKDRRIIIDRKDSHLHQGVAPYLQQICAQIECDKRKNIKAQVNFNQVIGQTVCVPTTTDDEIRYAIREGRNGYSRFVLNRTLLDTKSITIVLKKTNHFYKIITAYLGTKSQAEPWDKRADKKAIDFWRTHAFVYGGEPILEDTLTEECPWLGFEKVKKARN